MLMYLKPESTAIVTITASPPQPLREAVCADDVRSRGDSGEDPVFRRKPPRHREGLVVRDGLEVVDAVGVPVRHHEAGPALDEERPRCTTADRRRSGGLVTLNEHTMRLERVGDAHQRTGRSHSVAERSRSARCLVPDLLTKTVAMVGDDVRIVELIRRVVSGLRRQLRGTRDHVGDVLWRHLRRPLDGGDNFDLCSERPHQLEALGREAVGHDDECAIPLRTAHERECRTCATAGVLDDGISR
jgi:hypothetical protein